MGIDPDRDDHESRPDRRSEQLPVHRLEHDRERLLEHDRERPLEHDRERPLEHDLEHLYAGPARRTAVSPISRTLEIADRTPGMISFACGNPATEALPAAAIAEAAACAVRDDPVRALQYVRPRGILQDELIALLARRDGITARPEEVLPTSGAIQALSLVAHALLEPGDVVFTESPTYPINLGSFRAHGARVIGVPMDAEGMRVDLLARALERIGSGGSGRHGAQGNDRGATPGIDSRAAVKLIYVIPDAQNPTGITMSEARRRALVEVAAAHGVPIVEDAPYRGVDYAGEPVPTVYGLACAAAGAPPTGDTSATATFADAASDGATTAGAASPGATVLHVGSFAKTIAPGLRAGFLVAPPTLVDTCVMLKQGEDFCTSGLVQLIVRTLLRDGTLEATVEAMRTVQGRKLALMLEALDAHLGGAPGISWTRPRGGLFVWLTLPPGTDTDALLERAITERVCFIPGRYFYPPETVGADGIPRAGEPPAHELRLNFSDPPANRIGEGIATLARLVQGG